MGNILRKHLIVLFISVLFLAMFLTPMKASAAQWKGYVCRVMDFNDCKKGNKRIYPRPERYDDKETCYKEFENIYETDQEMNRLYPQTTNPRVIKGSEHLKEGRIKGSEHLKEGRKIEFASLIMAAPERARDSGRLQVI